MSEADAKWFIEQLKTDDLLREELAKAIRDGAAASVSNLGITRELEFTGAEVVKAYADLLDKKGLPLAAILDHGPGQVAYAAEPEASYSEHPTYAASPDGSAQYADPSTANYAKEASTHYAVPSSDDNE